MNNDINISIVIPTYNGKNKIVRILNKLKEQTSHSFEIIVVIDGSTDGTQNLLNSTKWDFNNIKIINQDNKGRAGSRNSGAKLVNSPIILFLDDDIVPSNTLVADHIIAQQKNDIVVGILESYDEGANPEMLAFSQYKNGKMNQSIFQESAAERAVPYISANNFSIKKQIFDELGAFDERLNDAEDFELAVRCKERGFSIFYAANCLAYHAIPASLSESARRSKEYKKGKDELLKFHPEIEKYIPNSINNIHFLKRPFFYLLSFPIWLKMADKNYFKILPDNLRFKLYDIIWTGNYYY